MLAPLNTPVMPSLVPAPLPPAQSPAIVGKQLGPFSPGPGPLVTSIPGLPVLYQSSLIVKVVLFLFGFVFSFSLLKYS